MQTVNVLTENGAVYWDSIQYFPYELYFNVISKQYAAFPLTWTVLQPLRPGRPPQILMDVPPIFVVNLHANIFSTTFPRIFYKRPRLSSCFKTCTTPVVVGASFTSNMCDSVGLTDDAKPLPAIMSSRSSPISVPSVNLFDTEYWQELMSEGRRASSSRVESSFRNPFVPLISNNICSHREKLPMFFCLSI